MGLQVSEYVGPMGFFAGGVTGHVTFEAGTGRRLRVRRGWLGLKTGLECRRNQG